MAQNWRQYLDYDDDNESDFKPFEKIRKTNRRVEEEPKRKDDSVVPSKSEKTTRN